MTTPHDKDHGGTSLTAVASVSGLVPADAAPHVAPKRSYAQIVVDAFTHAADRVPVCVLHENMLDVKTVKAGTKVTLGLPSHVFSANDALWFSGDLGQPQSSKPKYVGVIVFVPTELYENAPQIGSGTRAAPTNSDVTHRSAAPSSSHEHAQEAK